MHRVTSWEEWCLVYNDLSFWYVEIIRVCEQHGTVPRTVESTFPGTHAVFLVDHRIVLKFFCPVRYNSYHVELDTHRLMRHNRLVPEVVFSGHSPNGYDYIAFEFMDGLPIRESAPGMLTKESLDQLVDFILDLQTRTLEYVDGDVSCLVHYDLTKDHIFLEENGALTAIIDFGDALRAHPSAEFPVLFIDALDCQDEEIEYFTNRYNSLAGFYTIDNMDIARELSRHPFFGDINKLLEGKQTRFARKLLTLTEA